MKKCVFACLAALACVVMARQKEDPEEETEASTNWDTEVWTCAYNPIEEDDGTVTERNVEYYSRVK